MMREIVCICLMLAGVLFMLLSAVGLLRMPDLYLRISVAAKTATLGIGLVLLAALVGLPGTAVRGRIMAILVFVAITNPISAHMIARASYRAGIPLWKGTRVDHMKDCYNPETTALESSIGRHGDRKQPE